MVKWKVIGVDTKSPVRQDIVELINSGILEVPKTADGKYSNIASININAEVSIDGIKALTEKAGKISQKLMLLKIQI